MRVYRGRFNRKNTRGFVLSAVAATGKKNPPLDTDVRNGTLLLFGRPLLFNGYKIVMV